MDHWEKPLDLEIGDTIIWRGEAMRLSNDKDGMPAARKEGPPITEGSSVPRRSRAKADEKQSSDGSC